VDSHNIQEVLGVDVGAVRIGIARGNLRARIAQPVRTVPAANAFSEINNLINLYSSNALVIGLPRNLDGDETAQTKQVKSWAQQAKKHIKLPFFWQDEALTSHKAHQLKPSADNVGLDAEAAAIILQDFLDANDSDRVAV
jgi:putative Holliday junction resolvase